MGLAGVHLIVVSVWVGLVLAEVLLEVFAHRGLLVPAVATLHYWLDTLFEIPLLLGILATGVILTARLPDLDGLHAVKVASGLVAIGATAFAVRVVRGRREEISLPDRVAYHQRQLVLAAVVAVPAGVIAGTIGLTYAF
jgi:hypothetical protein